MLKEVTARSRFKLTNSTLTVSQLAIVNPIAILNFFESDNRLVIGVGMETVLDRLEPTIRIKLIAMDKRRRESDEFTKARSQYSCSSDLNRNNYNNRQAREYLNRQILSGI